MKISELIDNLIDFEEIVGDLDVKVLSIVYGETLYMPLDEELFTVDENNELLLG